MHCRPRQRVDKKELSKHVILYKFRFQAIYKYLSKTFWAINAALMTFEAKKSVNLISKLGCFNLNALKISKQYSYMTSIAFGVYADVVLLNKLNIFQYRFFSTKIYDILKNDIFTCSCWASVEN